MFSIFVCRLFICDSILISRFWINFTIIIRNSLSGRFPISSSFVWFGGLLSCSFTCSVFLYLFILVILLHLGGLSVFWQFVEFSLLWRFLAVCGYVEVACQGFLVREACVGVLVGGAVFLLSPFEELGCFSGCLMSSAGIQKLFCGIYSTFKCSFDEFVGEKVFSPSYSSAILAPPLHATF